MRERGSIIGYCGVGALAKFDQLLASTVKAVAMRIELKACKDATDLDEMVRVFRTNQKMEVDEARPCGDIEPHFDIREDKVNVGKAAGAALPKHLFICVCDVIVCNSNGFNFGR